MKTLKLLFVLIISNNFFLFTKESNNFKDFEDNFRKTYRNIEIPRLAPHHTNVYWTKNPYSSQAEENHFKELNSFKDLTNSLYAYYSNYDIKSWPYQRLLLYNPFQTAGLYPLDFEKYKFNQEFYNAMTRLKYDPTIGVDDNSSSFFTLHECGHHALSKYLPCDIDEDLQLAATVGTFGLWGKHKKIPYKNKFTKITSKTIASLIVSYAAKVIYNQIHERYADSFACRNAIDKACLEEGLKILKTKQEYDEKILNEKKIPSYLRFLYNFYNDPYHPSDSTRIKQINDAIQKRFPK